MMVRSSMMAVVALWAQISSGQAPELGQGWISEYKLAARQVVSLAEAIPAEKFSWRPQRGVRSTSEVFMQVAFGNYWILDQAGGNIPTIPAPIPANNSPRRR